MVFLGIGSLDGHGAPTYKQTERMQFLMSTISPLLNPRRVYCAGPLFNEAERGEMLRLAEVLKVAGFDPFVPHADGMEFAKLQPYLVGQGYAAADAGVWLHAAIFALDTYQVVVGCGSLVINLNGRVPDEGAVAEATMAWMLGKPVVAYKEDLRSVIEGRDNPLVIGQTRFEIETDLDRLGQALAERIAVQTLPPDWTTSLPRHVQETVSAGAQLWRELEPLDAAGDLAPLAEAVLDLFGPERQTC